MKLNPRTLWAKVPKKVKSKKFAVIIITGIIIFQVLTRGGANTRLITTATVQKKPIESQVSASGVVKSDQQTKLLFPVSGKVAWIGVSKGEYVYAGQTIASLDSRNFQAALRQAQQDVIAADAILEQTYNNIHLNGAENFDQRVQRTSAEAQKNKAYDAMKKAEKDLADSTIYAPFGGTIIDLTIVPGQQVTATFQAGEIANIENIYFSADVDETDVTKVKPGQKTTIILDAFDAPLETTVLRISESATTTSTGATAFETILGLPNHDNFKIGMNGEARITTKSADNTTVIPIDAIVDNNFVWAELGKTYQKVQIETGIESDDEVQVTSGLEANQTVVTSGFLEITKKSLLNKILVR